jgi:hypothetical protein
MGVISSAELHNVRSGHEWALIALDEKTGLVAIQSSCGSFNHIWPPQYRDQPLGEFIATLDFDYFMGKTRGQMAFEFDEARTRASIKDAIKRSRRDGHCTKAGARDAMDELEYIEEGMSREAFAHELNTSVHILDCIGHDDWCDHLCKRYTPECEWFWKTIWAAFRWQILCRDGLESPLIGL